MDTYHAIMISLWISVCEGLDIINLVCVESNSKECDVKTLRLTR